MVNSDTNSLIRNTQDFYSQQAKLLTLIRSITFGHTNGEYVATVDRFESYCVLK